MGRYVVPLDSPGADIATVGGKGASLARMVRSGLPVPEGFGVTTTAYREFVEANNLQPLITAALDQVDVGSPEQLDAVSQTIRGLFDASVMPLAIATAIDEAYADLDEQPPAVAVRSSATAEDLPEASFAGQQETYLNVKGEQAVRDAVKRCWASLWTARAIGYRRQKGVEPEDLSLAVVVQRLVPADAAGVMFTANPVNGRRDELLISAAWGLGESVVGGNITPDDITVDKESLIVLERETAEKDVMTVLADSGTQEQSVPEDKRRLPVLDDVQVTELARIGVEIEALYEQPMDIEWARVGDDFAIVQARPITALPEPSAPPPETWPMPDPKGQYIRTSIIDFLPDPLSPLFETLGLAVINKGFHDLVVYIGGPRDALPDEMFTTINGYAYMVLNFTLAQWWKLTVGIGPGIPRMLRTGKERWLEDARPRYLEVVNRWQARALADLAPSEILDGAWEILDAMDYYLGTLQSGIMGNAAFTEGVFTMVYDKLIKREGDPDAPTFLLGFESTPIRAETDLYDLGRWIRDREALAAYVRSTRPEQLADDLASDRVPETVPGGDWHAWQQRFQDHLETYGHSIYSLDFATPVPADDPETTLRTLQHYVRGKGVDPQERRQRLVERREQATEAVASRLRGLRLRWFRKTLRRAQDHAPLREDAIADIGLGYPRLRAMLRELGSRFVGAGAVRTATDVFWLYHDEVELGARSLERSAALPDWRDQVEERKMTWRGENCVTPPPQLPPKGKVLGLDAGAFIAAEAEQQDGSIIKGLGASPGRVTATARVLGGPEDFNQMEPGDILVAAITTPAWTPLFAMASGIVTDIGGPMSHGSIVAREYSIPAVLGTGVATRRIRSGMTVTVNGDTGQVVLEGYQDEGAAP
ncbi:MAG: PEP/pyruvate-binding domain-containing protein [Anaerolineae bacterium]